MDNRDNRPSLLSNVDSLELNQNDAEHATGEASSPNQYLLTSSDSNNHKYFHSSEAKFIHDMNQQAHKSRVSRISPEKAAPDSKYQGFAPAQDYANAQVNQAPRTQIQNYSINARNQQLLQTQPR